jgi:xanthine dehydrogenase YagS FAD-binding subunit
LPLRRLYKQAVAFAALGAMVQITGKHSERTISFAEFHRPPADTPHLDANPNFEEVVTEIDCG